MEDQDASIAAFSSSALLGLMSLIFLLAMPHRFSMEFRSGEFAGQSSTVILRSCDQVLVLLAVWGRCQVLLENEVSIPIELVCGRKHDVLQNLLVDCCGDPELNEEQWTNTSR